MKNLLLFIVVIAISIGCDKIENPVIEKGNSIDTDLYPGEGNYFIPEFGEYPSEEINILIEDFTGHKCGNCPGAATIAHSIQQENPERVIVAAIHSSPPPYAFQTPNESDDEDYPKYNHDFRTESGNQYPLDIEGFIGNPVGLVNRVTDDSQQIWQFHPNWNTRVNEILSDNSPLIMNVQVNTNYYTETRGLFIHVLSETLLDIEGRYTMVVYLIDDERIDWQKDYTQNPQDIEFYHHSHVLLDNINGTYGDQLFASTSVAGESFENHYTYALPEDIELDSSNPEEETGLSVIVYLMNRDTYEIVQVIQKEVLVTF